MGLLDRVLDFSDDVTFPKRKKHKPMQTVEIKVKMDCDGCERRVRNAVTNIKGVQSVDVNRKQSKVTVTGNIEPKKVLKKVKSTGTRAEFWSYVPYNLVSYPYAPQAYDKKAPSGYVKNAPQAFATPGDLDDRYTCVWGNTDNSKIYADINPFCKLTRCKLNVMLSMSAYPYNGIGNGWSSSNTWCRPANTWHEYYLYGMQPPSS